MATNERRAIQNFGHVNSAIVPILVGSAMLVLGCVDEWEGGYFDPEDVELREEDKVEEFNPLPPPSPPGPEADEDQDLRKKGKGKKMKNIGPDDIKDRYIVVLTPDGDPVVAAKAVGAAPEKMFTTAIRGFSGALNEGQITALEARADVESIEPDQIVSGGMTQYMDLYGQPWGLDRIDQPYLPLNGRYIYYSGAWGVRVYVIDSGLANHPDFYNAYPVFDAWDGAGLDCHGHGTHVAGTIGGNVYGVAKQSFVRAVKVLDCTNRGSVSGFIAGIDWVAKNHIKPAVANLSLGVDGGTSDALDTAVNNLANSGVFVAVSAGNDGVNACNRSPARAANAFVTASSGRSDFRAWNTNWGPCVTAYAPGVEIRSTWLGNSTRIMSGTSMASPHVAATAAVYKAVLGDRPWDQIKWDLVEWSTKNVIKNNAYGTANAVIYQPF